MMKLTIGNREFNVQFGYKATIQTRLISRLVRMNRTSSDENSGEKVFERVEKSLEFLPEFLLIALQRHHRDEFGFNYVTGEGKEELIDKVYDLLEEYSETEGNDLGTLFGKLNEEMENDGFLAKMLQTEQVKVEEQEQEIKLVKKKLTKKIEN